MLSSRFLAALVATVLCAAVSRAQTVFWANAGTDFTLGANWIGGVVPVNDTTTTVAAFGTGLIVQPQLNSAYSVNGLRFAGDAGSYTLTGTGPLTIGASGIDNQGPAPQLIAVPLVFTGTSSFIYNQSSLTLSGTITNNTTAGVSFSGTGGAGVASGVISGAGGLTKSNTGTWTFSGANTYSGGTTVSGGALVVTNTTGSGTGTGTVTVSGNAELRVGNGGTAGVISGNVSVTTANNSAVRFNRSDASTYAGTVSGAGNFYKDGAGTLTLTGAQTLTGATGIFDGVLRLGGANLLSPSSDVVFGTTSTPTLDLNNFNQTVATITNNGGSTNGVVLLGSGTLTLSVSAATGGGFGGTISGTGGLVKAGTGTQFLYGANTYSGGTSVSAGTLWLINSSGSATGTGNVTIAADGALFVGNGNATGAFSGSVANAGWLRFARSDNLTYAGVISGAGVLEKQGTGKLTLTGANTFSGNTSVNSGTLAIGNGGTTGALAGNVSVFSTLEFNRSNAYTFTGNVSGSGNVVQAGSGTLTLSGANTYSGITQLNAGSLAGGAANALSPNSTIRLNSGTSVQAPSSQVIGGLEDLSTGVTGNVTLSNGAVLTLNRTDNAGINFSGVISGNGTLVKTGSGPQVLSGANTYNGGTMVNGGALRLGINNALPVGGNVTLGATGGNSGVLELQGHTQTIGALLFNGNGGSGASVLIGAGGTLTVNGALSLDGTNSPGLASISGGTLALGSANRTLTIGDSSGTFVDLSISSAISAAGATLTKAGAGTLQLSGTSNHAATVINEGRLQLGANNALPAGANVTINGSNSFASSTFELGNFTQSIGALTFGGISGNSGGVVLMNTAGVLTLGGNVTVDPANHPSGHGIFGGVLALGGNRTFNVGNSSTAFSDLTISSVITGPGFGLTKTGTGTLVLSGANTFSGTTIINAGSLLLASGGSLSSSPVVVNATTPGGSAILEISTSTEIGTLTFGGAGATSTSNNSVYIIGTLTPTGAIVYDATNNPLGAQINGSTLQLNGTQVFNVGNSSSAINDLIIGAEIGGPGGLTKAGAGTLLLTNWGNKFSGPIAVQQGVLSVDAVGMIGASSPIGGGASPIAIGNAATGATLRYTGTSISTTDRPLDLAGTTGGGTLDVSTPFGGVNFTGNVTASGAGSKTLTLSSSSSSASQLAGAISDNSATNKTSLFKTGFGTWVLSGANTYTGGTTISGGTLQLGANNTLPAGGDVTINATAGQAVLDLASTAQSIGALIFGGTGASGFASNQVVLGSTGTLTLGGNVTYNTNNNPAGAYISGYSLSDERNPLGGSLSLGGATRTFNIGNSSATPFELTILSNITGGSGVGLTKTGAGSLTLAGQSTYLGNTTVTGGTLFLAASTIDDGGIISGPLGRGTLFMQGGTTLAPTTVVAPYSTIDGDIFLSNAVSLANNVTLGADVNGGEQTLTFAGTVTAADAATTWHLGGNAPLIFTGTLTGANPSTALVIDSGGHSGLGRVIIGSAVGSNLGSITADHSAVIFASASSLAHTAAVNVTNNGYVGVGATGLVAPPAPSALIARIANPATFTGTFGFDTNMDLLGAPHDFAATAGSPIDFSAFGSGLTIGSSTAAILSGPLIPASNGYQFGNGGGVLFVLSDLVDGSASRGVTITSNPSVPHSALTTVFEGNNTFTGNLSVTHSLAVLNSAHALPTGSTINLGAGGYVGYTELFTNGGAHGTVSFGSFISRLGSYTPTSVIGLDSADYLSSGGSSDTFFGFGSRFVTDTLDLSSLGSIYLGTATDALIAGPILAPNQNGANRTLSLLAADSGYLTVFSRLGPGGNVAQLVVGANTNQLGSGAVVLAGNNTYAGGTTLLSGSLLLLGNSRTTNGSIVSGPIGTGALTVATGAIAPNLDVYDPFSSSPVLHNAINLGATLQIAAPLSEDSAGVETTSFLGSFSNLVLNGIIADVSGGAGGLALYTSVTLNGANTYSGGTSLFGGTLTLGSNSALGTGALTITSSDSRFDSVALKITNGSRTLANNVVLNLFNDPYLPVGGRGSLTLNGTVTLNSSVTLAPENYPILLNGAVSGSGRLTLDGPNRLFLNGANTYLGGTRAEQGAIVFGGTSAIPASGASLSTNYDGYIGLATPPSNLQADFIDKFNKGSTIGTVGFDSPVGGSTNTFTGNINLTGFASGARLGSATTAILTGTITPGGFDYAFGGGGGLLQVNSALTDGPSSRGVQIFSPDHAPLTLRLGGINTFTGGIYVDSSGLIFRPGSMPAAGSTYAYRAYVGTEDTALAPGAFIGTFDAASYNPIVGFDSFSGTPYTIASGTTVDLSHFSSGSHRIFLGSATSAEINGPITLPSGQASYLFAGYKGGRITIGSQLSGSRQVEIGDLNLPATFGTPMDMTAPRSAVTLSGANTYTGGTWLNAGVLNIGHDSALGTGTLTVASNTLGTLSLGLFATGGSRSLSNPVVLNGDLDIGGGDNLSLAGVISGPGELYKIGGGTLTLSGNNTFSGGIYIAQGTVNFASANALGTGPLQLGTAAGPTAAFSVSATVNGISANNSSDTLQINSGAPLTINQTFDAQFLGSIVGGGSVVYGGPNTSSPTQLRLAGANSYSGTSTINGGVVLVAASNTALGSGAATLGGGTLVVESGVTLTNAFTLSSGTLGGAGTLRPPSGVVVGTGVTLAPGMDTIGTFTFDGTTVTGPALTLAPGGVYNWQLIDALANGDRVNVTGTAAITSTAGAPFTLRLSEAGSLDLLSISAIANFNPTQSYSWTVLNATNVTGFTAGSFAVDWSAISGYTGGGTFAVSLNNTNTSLMLNFTPIPEPSTYVLLLLGSAMVFAGVRRRRK